MILSIRKALAILCLALPTQTARADDFQHLDTWLSALESGFEKADSATTLDYEWFDRFSNDYFAKIEDVKTRNSFKRKLEVELVELFFVSSKKIVKPSRFLNTNPSRTELTAEENRFVEYLEGLGMEMIFPCTNMYPELKKIKSFYRILENPERRRFVFNHLRLRLSKKVFASCASGLSEDKRSLCKWIKWTLIPRGLFVTTNKTLGDKIFRPWPYAYIFIKPFVDLLLNKDLFFVNARESYRNNKGWLFVYLAIFTNGHLESGTKHLDNIESLIAETSELQTFQNFRSQSLGQLMSTFQMTEEQALERLTHIIYGNFNWALRSIDPIQLLGGLHTTQGLQVFLFLRALRGNFAKYFPQVPRNKIDFHAFQPIQKDLVETDSIVVNNNWFAVSNYRFPGLSEGRFRMVQFDREMWASPSKCFGKASSPKPFPCSKTLFPSTTRQVDRIIELCSDKSFSARVAASGRGGELNCYPIAITSEEAVKPGW